MTDAAIARRAERIRAAFAAARFDERTPDEAGFSAVFENEIKPKLVAQVEANLKIAAERARRKRVANLITLPLLPFTLLMLLPLFGPGALSLISEEYAKAHFFTLIALPIGGTFLGWGLLAFLVVVQFWARAMRSDEKDPNRVFAAEKLLERFGCRLIQEPGFASSVRRSCRSARP
jgi:hypothetical protein